MTTLWKLQGASYTMYFERQFKDGYGSGASLSLSLYGSSARAAWKEGSFTGDPEGYVKKALEPLSLFNRGPVG
jgi:hypothetical protein